MGLLNSALQIGRSAILGYEGAINVIGNNISGAASPDYTRLTPQLDPVHGRFAGTGVQPGAGVALTDIRRNIDESLEGRVRLAMGSYASLATQDSVLARVEALFDDLSGNGVGVRLGEFFSAFDEVQNTPEDLGIRDLAIHRSVLLADALRGLRTRLTQISDDIDHQIAGLANQADGLAREIARLNQEITREEGGRSTQASALRDQRGALLRDLSEIFDVTVREQPDGTVNVYAGSEALIQGASVRGLVAETELVDGSSRTTVRFADTNQELMVRGGQLAGLLVSRNQNAQIAAVDELASALIAEVNRIHADGQGLVGYAEVVGSFDILETGVPLDSPSAGLSGAIRNGSFFISVTDSSGNVPVAYRIDVDADGTDAGTTLEALVASINDQVGGVTASITPDRRFEMVADDGFTFTFGFDGQDSRPDTSGVLSALGINTLFTGTDASDIGVHEAIRNQPELLAAASSFLSGDGTMAGAIAALDSGKVESFGGTSLLGFYNTIANRVAITSAGTKSDVEASFSVLQSLEAQRQSIVGVNLDEEAIALVKYQRAFQGVARFVSTVDELLAQLILMIR